MSLREWIEFFASPRASLAALQLGYVQARLLALCARTDTPDMRHVALAERLQRLITSAERRYGTDFVFAALGISPQRRDSSRGSTRARASASG